jgi:MmyB-like transcription regulator ligand binding domain
VVTDIIVSEFREVAGTDLGDPRLRATIDELSAHSPRFRELWARADVGYQPGPMDLHHPQLGDLHLHRTRLWVPHSDGQHLLIYHGEPGSASAKALEAPGHGQIRHRARERQRQRLHPDEAAGEKGIRVVCPAKQL